MGIEKAKINIVMVGHVDYEKSITIKELNKPVAEKQIAEMNLTAIYKAWPQKGNQKIMLTK